MPISPLTMSVTLAFASFEDRLPAEAGDDEGVWIAAAHAQFTHTLVHDHVEDFAMTTDLPERGKPMPIFG